MRSNMVALSVRICLVVKGTMIKNEACIQVFLSVIWH